MTSSEVRTKIHRPRVNEVILILLLFNVIGSSSYTM